MKTALYCRAVFGGSAVLLGVISLLWYDSDTWQTLRQLWRLPFGTIIGSGLMIAQIAGGIGMQFPPFARWASIILGVVYALFSLACIPDIIAAPGIYVHYGSFFEQFSALSGAVALYAATANDSSRRAMACARAARLGLGLSAVSFTLSQIIYLSATAELVPKWLPPSQSFWAILTTIAFALAAISILIDRRATLATRLLTLMLAMFGLIVWAPRLIAHPEAHINWSEFGMTFLIAGAAWMVAALKPHRSAIE